MVTSQNALGDQSLTCTLGSAHKRWSRWASSSLSRPSQQHTDVVLCVWIQVPQLIGNHVDSMYLWPRRLTGAVLNLLPDNGAISQDRVGVKLDDQVSGAGTQQLGWCNGWRRYCERKWNVFRFSAQAHICTGQSNCWWAQSVAAQSGDVKLWLFILLISCTQTDFSLCWSPLSL